MGKTIDGVDATRKRSVISKTVFFFNKYLCFRYKV